MFWSSTPKKEEPPFEEREIPENVPLSDDEKKVLAECFKVCENKDTEEFLGAYDPYFFTRIVRGYKDYKPRIGETAKAMDKIYKWRKENDVDQIIKIELANSKRFNKELWPCRYHGQDRMGHLVMSEILEDVSNEPYDVCVGDCSFTHLHGCCPCSPLFRLNLTKFLKNFRIWMKNTRITKLCNRIE